MKPLRAAIKPLRLFVLTTAFIFVSLLGLVTGQSLAEPDVPTGLLERKGDKIVAAPTEDLALAKTYHVFKDKGRLVAGQRITIMTQKTRYRVGESVRVLHILEAVEPGKSVHLMGPKKVYDEYVDGKLASAKGPGKAPYRGMVADRPIADFNYEITAYAFTEPGAHTIQWKGGGASVQGSLGLESNIIKLEVMKPEYGEKKTEQPPNVSVQVKAVQYPHLTVTMKNNTENALRVWDNWNSWGWWNLSFCVVLKDGQVIHISAKDRGWDRNAPTFSTIQPGDEWTRKVDFSDEQWEIPKEFSPKDIRYFSAVYCIKPSEESAKHRVWTGVSVSPWVLPTVLGEGPNATSPDRATSGLQSLNGGASGGDTNIIAVSDWSKPVGTSNGQTLRGRMSIVQENSPAHAGPFPETELYLELQNVSGAAGAPMQIYFDPGNGLHCELLDANGKPPPQAAGRGSGGGPGACWITLPYDSTIRLRANMYGYGKQKGDGLLLVLSPPAMQYWNIQAGDTNVYYMSGTFTVTPPTNHVAKDIDAVRSQWSGILKLPKMKISVKKP
jgi:hypothetical protein